MEGIRTKVGISVDLKVRTGCIAPPLGKFLISRYILSDACMIVGEEMQLVETVKCTLHCACVKLASNP